MDDDEPDDKLLSAPEQQDSSDSVASSRRSILTHEHQMAQLYAEQNGTAPARMLMPWSTPREKQRLEEEHRKQQLAVEQQMRVIAERQDLLLQQIEQEQAQVAVRHQEIEDNAMRLRDGRRAYVDGDRFRDGEGIVLTGADEAEAARQHEYRPDASTWAEKQENERQAEELKTLKQKIVNDKAGGQGPPSAQEARLDGYEKEFTAAVHGRQDAMNAEPAKNAPSLPDYGNANYMDDYQLSSAPAFNDASGITTAAVPKPKDDESEAPAPQTKVPLSAPGPGSGKPV
jgi:hypothetical protein